MQMFFKNHHNEWLDCRNIHKPSNCLNTPYTYLSTYHPPNDDGISYTPKFLFFRGLIPSEVPGFLRPLFRVTSVD